MNTKTLTLTLNESYFVRRNWFDWFFAFAALVGGSYVLLRYGGFMDVYEKAILLASIPAAIWIGWFWKPLRVFSSMPQTTAR